MILKVNGKEQAFDQEQLSVAQLLKVAKVESPDMVSVQLNGKFVKKGEYESTNLKESDEVDFLYFMGGGILDPRYSILDPRQTME